MVCNRLMTGVTEAKPKVVCFMGKPGIGPATPDLQGSWLSMSMI